MLLIYPPSVRSTEPPLGIARLAALLRAHGRPCLAVDLNAASLDHLLSIPADCVERSAAAFSGKPLSGSSLLALRRREANLALLRSPGGYQKIERYTKAVQELSRALSLTSLPYGATVGLADYREEGRSPLSRKDLIDAASSPESSVYHDFYREKVAGALETCRERHGDLPRTVGVSLCFLSQALPAFALIGVLKRDWPELAIVLGGGLVTSWVAEGALSPEETFGGLVEALLPGRGEDSLPDYLGFGQEADVPPGASPGCHEALSPRRALPPDYDDFDFSRYLSPGPIIPYTFSSGCPWSRCAFCPEVAEGSRYVAVNAREAVGELKALVDRYRPVLLHLTDNEISPLYLRSLSEAKLGVPWYGFARFSRELLDPVFCRALADSGCRMLQLGLESGSQRVLDEMGKGTLVAENEVILENLREAGIGTFVYVLFGTPSEGETEARLTGELVSRHERAIDFLNVAIFNLPSSSRLAQSLQTRPFYEGELSLYSEFSHPSGWNRSRVRSFLAKEFEADPLIRPILQRCPPVFTSNHAPFFCSS